VLITLNGTARLNFMNHPWETGSPMLAALILTTLAVTARVLSSGLELWNLAPMGAISLYAGSRIPRRFAWLIPLAAMVISDAILDAHRTRPWLEPSRFIIYACFAGTTLLGGRFPRLSPVSRLPILALSASTLFYLVSNFAVWLEGALYPHTIDGLLICYVAAIPFYVRTLAGDMIVTALLFVLAPRIERFFAGRPAVVAAFSGE
jgi:hypothetical protein